MRNTRGSGGRGSGGRGRGRVRVRQPGPAISHSIVFMEEVLRGRRNGGARLRGRGSGRGRGRGRVRPRSWVAVVEEETSEGTVEGTGEEGAMGHFIVQGLM